MPYQQRYVAFIDILGFGQIVNDTGRVKASPRFDADRLVQILTKMGTRDEDDDEESGDDFRFQTFSDSVVMSETVGAIGLNHLTRAIRSLTIELLQAGMLMRGGIGKGLLHHDGKVMFGPAFLDAYRIESTVANFPRVVLGRDVYADFNHFVLKAKPPMPKSRVLLAEDGPPFINTLELFKPSKISIIARARERRAKSCHGVLQELLNESIHEPRHFDKLRWFAMYWNSVAKKWADHMPQLTFPASVQD